MKTASALSALLISGLAVAEAKDCRETELVIKSTTSETQNTSDMGHVYWHVDGYQTVKDKTQFMKWTDFTTAFTALQKAKIKNAAKCSENKETTQFDCIDAKTAGVTKAQRCDATNSKQG